MKQTKVRLFSRIIGLFLLTLIPLTVNAQKAKSKDLTRVIDDKINSKLMKRELPYRVILPTDYNASNEQTFYPTVYLLHGLTGHYDNWGDRAKLEKYTSAYKYIIVMPEGNNGWYTDSELEKADKYESYLIKELIPEIEKKFRAKKDRNSRVVAGLSMGGFGAMKFGLKYPDKFILAGSFSGALRAAEWDGKSFGAWKALSESITKTFGDLNSETRKSNNIFKTLEAKSKEEVGKLPFFYLDCGTEDFLIKQNQDFASLLFKQKVPHEFRQLPGEHNWQYWESQIQEFLDLTRKHIK